MKLSLARAGRQGRVSSEQQTGNSHLGCGCAEDAGRQETAQGVSTKLAWQLSLRDIERPGKPALAPIEATRSSSLVPEGLPAGRCCTGGQNPMASLSGVPRKAADGVCQPWVRGHSVSLKLLATVCQESQLRSPEPGRGSLAAASVLSVLSPGKM